MLRLRFRQYENAEESVVETAGNRRVNFGSRIGRRWCFGLAVIASILALLAISIAFPILGVAVDVAAILLFAFFS
jgi:hypothetical protein